MVKQTLFGSTLPVLQQLFSEWKEPRFRAKQLTEWLYSKNADNLESMTNLSKVLREKLAARFAFGTTDPILEEVSRDKTRKYLFNTAAGDAVESAYIPDGERATLCVSTQAGCKMGCKFCGTAKQGFQNHLTAGEIVNQFRSLPERDTISNIVYMGMGEPMDNLEAVLDSLDIMTSGWGYAWSPTRITVSSVGLIDPIRIFLEKSKAHLAISLHSPFEKERNRLMPVTVANPLVELFQMLRSADWWGQRRLTFEYILFDGINDTKKHAESLARLIRGLRCRINLIPFHDVPGSDFKGADRAGLERFQKLLEPSRATVTIRKSRGLDIRAACGLLATEKSHKE